MTNCAELADYEWLTGSEASTVLTELATNRDPVHTATDRLRRQFSPVRVHLMLEQAELRGRAAVKFERANDMFFTRLALEQATDGWVAAYKAQRFRERGQVADLCCGIGGDLLAIGTLGPAIGVDQDPTTAHFAAANARALGVAASVETRDIESFDACGVAAWHIDPDRRPNGNRTTELAWSSPSLGAIERMLSAAPKAAVKLAPAADVPPEWIERCELEWISRDRQCRQQVAWHGELAVTPGHRRATVLSFDGMPLRTMTGQPNQPSAFTDRLDRFLFEPDAAVLAARLGGALAAERTLSAFSAGIAYLTGPAAIDDPALACFEVEEILPLDLRQLARYLHARNIGRLEVKKRGVEHDPATVRKQLQLAGDETATLILTKLNRKRMAIVCRRIESRASDLRPLASPHATCL